MLLKFKFNVFVLWGYGVRSGRKLREFLGNNKYFY